MTMSSKCTGMRIAGLSAALGDKSYALLLFAV